MAKLVIALARPKFPLGRTVITQTALAEIDPADIQKGLFRHARGDWGEVCPEDARSNAAALTRGGRLLSAYGQGDKRFWIITEGNFAVTTVLLPQDY